MYIRRTRFHMVMPLALGAILLFSQPSSAQAKCGGRADFMTWFQSQPTNKVVFVGTVMDETHWDRSRNGYNAVRFEVERVLVGPETLAGTELVVPGGICSNTAPDWKTGSTHVVGAEYLDGHFEFPLCAEPGLYMNGESVWDRDGQPLGSMESVMYDLRGHLKINLARDLSVWLSELDLSDVGFLLLLISILAMLATHRFNAEWAYRVRYRGLVRSGRLSFPRRTTEPTGGADGAR